MAQATLVRVLLLLTACQLASADPWDLRDYKRCEFLKQKNIRADLSGVTYSAVTGTVWTVTRAPMIFSEYSLPKGKFLRDVPSDNIGLRDPEGIAWMYDYTFAIAQERSDDSSRESMITIVKIEPWRERATVIRKLVIPIDMNQNQGLEGLTWDPMKKMLIGGQEKPMKAWEIDPVTGKYKHVLKDAERRKNRLWDFAGVYKRAGDPGLYVLSEPTEYVFHLDEDGREIDGQVMHIDNAKLPEGLTFTPDGALLIAVGEPNEMFIYSSTGSCDWSPEDAAGGSVGSSDDDDDSTPIYTTPGFCSWKECTTGRQGIPWCSATVDNCVSKCGGWWCSDILGVPPITEDTWESPPAPPAPQVPWYEDSALGYCVYNSCDGVEVADPWCRNAMSNCAVCKGTWCPKPAVEGDVEPITADSAQAIIAAADAEWFEDPANGYCNYNGCDGVEAGAPWCIRSQGNCNACQGTWCPKASVGGGVQPIEPDNSPWFEDPEDGYCNFNGCDGIDSAVAWCRLSQGNCNSCRGTWCPKGNLVDKVDPILPADKDGQGNSEIKKVPLEDPGAVADGYQALVSLLLDGTSDPGLVGSLTEAAAASAYGSKAAVVSVAAVNATHDTTGRRLQGAVTQPNHVILVLNGESAHHAGVLAQRLERDVQSGKVREHAQTLMGGADVGQITLEFSIIKSAGMSPQQFPVSPALVLDEVPEIVLEPVDEPSCLSNPVVIAGIVCGGCALLAGIGFAVRCAYARASKKSNLVSAFDGPPVPKSGFTDAGTDSSAKSTLDVSSGFPARYKRSSSNLPLLDAWSATSSPAMSRIHSTLDCELAMPVSHSRSRTSLLNLGGEETDAQPSMLCKVESDAIMDGTPESSPARVGVQRTTSVPSSVAGNATTGLR